MTDKKNRGKRYILAGVIIAAAAFFGIERCADNEPDQPVEQHASKEFSSNNTSETHTIQSISPSELKETEQTNSLYNKASGVANTAHKVAQKKHQEYNPNTSPLNHKKTLSKQPSLHEAQDIPVPKDSSSVRQYIEPTQGNTTEEKSNSTLSAVIPDKGNDLSFAAANTFPHRHLFRIGLRAGAGYSKMTSLGSIIESYNVRPTFTMNERGDIAPRIGIFGTWQYHRSGAELNIVYTRISSKLTEYKIPEKVTETTRFHYNFITPQLLLRFYAFPKFYMGAGISAAIPFGSRNIDFTTDRIGEVYRQQAERVQDHLREAIKARVAFIPTIKIGYVDTKSGLEAGLEYGFGMNDMLRTSANDYGYQERTNNLQAVSLTIGYSLPLNKAE